MVKHLFWRTRRVFSTYADRLAAFQPNARLYLLNAIIGGLAMGIFRLLFNFYLLSLGFEKDVVGNLISASSLTALIAALPMGYLVDRIGHKPALVAGGMALVVALSIMVAAPILPVLVAMNVILGLAQSLSGVTTGPFLMENSSEKERVYLFSMGMGVTMTAGFVGNWVGGYLPTWLSGLVGDGPTSTAAYAASLYAVGARFVHRFAARDIVGDLLGRDVIEGNGRQFVTRSQQSRVSGQSERRADDMAVAGEAGE